MAYQVFFNRLSFQEVRTDNPTVPVGDPVTIDKGGRVPTWVTPFQINALLNAGMIVEVGDDLRTDLHPVEEVPVQPRTPDQPDILPSDPQGIPPTVGGQGPDAVVVDEPEDDGPATRPSDNDNKAAWEKYAAVGLPEGKRIPLAEAEAMTKKDLVAEVKRREITTSPVTP